MLHACSCWTSHPRKAYVSRAATVFNELKKPYVWSLIAAVLQAVLHKLWQAHSSWIWKIVGYTCFYNLVHVNHVYNQKLPNLTSGKRWRSYPGPCWWQAPANLLGLCRSYLGVKRPDSTNRKIDTVLDDIHFHADAQFSSAANPFDMCLIGYIIRPFWQRGYSIIFGWMRSPTSMPMNQPDPSIIRHATSKRDSS